MRCLICRNNGFSDQSYRGAEVADLYVTTRSGAATIERLCSDIARIAADLGIIEIWLESSAAASPYLKEPQISLESDLLAC